MYLEKIRLENTGPIEKINYALPFDDNGRPKPVIFVGCNGAGKSILLGHIVSTVLLLKQIVFDDIEIEKSTVYKVRSPQYIKYGKAHSLAKLAFSNDFNQSEIQMNVSKKHFKDEHKYEPQYEKWKDIPEDESSHHYDNFYKGKNELEELLRKTSFLFFPPNRFEDPAWLNTFNLLNKPTYQHISKMRNISNRKIINYSPLRENQNWLLDLIYDHQVFEATTPGSATNIQNEIKSILSKILQEKPPLTWNLGTRMDRTICITGRNKKTLSNNLFSLSTGQTLILNVLLSLVKDFDLLSNGTLPHLSDIKGIVVIDEVDLHLHADFQYSILPELIALFPCVQFILTSHSPLFLLGLKEKLGHHHVFFPYSLLRKKLLFQLFYIKIPVFSLF